MSSGISRVNLFNLTVKRTLSDHHNTVWFVQVLTDMKLFKETPLYFLFIT